MSFAGSRFLRDLTGEIGSDASEISDVNSSDIDHIIKSVDDLDKDVFGVDSFKEKTQGAVKSPMQGSSTDATKKPRKNTLSSGFDNELGDFLISDDVALSAQTKTLSASKSANKSEEAKIGQSKKITDLFGLDDGGPNSVETVDRKEVGGRENTNKRGSDWLGLKDSPPPGSGPQSIGINLNDELGASSPVKLAGDEGAKIGKSRVLKSEEGFLTGIKNRSSGPKPGKPEVKSQQRVTTAKQITSAPNILSNILGSEGQLNQPDEGSKSMGIPSSGGYEPSLGETRRRGPGFGSRRRDIHSAQALNTTYQSSRQTDDIDWLLGPKQTKSLEMTQLQVAEKEVGTALPEWLGGSGTIQSSKKAFAASVMNSYVMEGQEKLQDAHPVIQFQNEKVGPFPEDNPIHGREGMMMDDDEIPAKASMTGDSRERPEERTEQKEKQSNAVARVASENIIFHLETLQNQLKNAMARHQSNLEKYMKAIIQEAEILNCVDATNPSHFSDVKSHENVKKHIVERTESEEKLIQVQKEKDELIHEQKMAIQRLELQNEHGKMKIEGIQLAHKHELAILQKAHEHEISLWSDRLERLQKLSVDMQEEMETRLAKMKSHEDELVGSYKQRIETLQEERLADLKQLGEFHKLALEQVSNLTVYYPNARSGIKLPLRLPGKPSTEEELTEREKALIEKERQLQVKEAELVIQKEDLDHEKQKERTKWEEKERELKRARSETRLKEEFHSNELTYEKKHLQIIKAEIERMKEIVVKEQAELTLEKLSLAAEKAKLETVLKLQQSGNQNMSNYDLLQAQAELQAALSVAKEAQEAALAERRKMEQTRQDLEAITWQQQAKDQQLDNREKHIMNILQESEVKREEGLKFFEEARRMKTEVLEKQEELQGLISKIEMKEKEMAKERMELAKEKIELDRRKVQLDLVLPELTPAESLVINPPRNYIDPKVLIMKLKAEKELDSYFAPQRGSRLTQQV